MKPCVIIPCYNHVATVEAVARGAQAHCPVIVVDDGSTPPLLELFQRSRRGDEADATALRESPPRHLGGYAVTQLAGITLVRLVANSGKGAALRAGFQLASELGYTHAITVDSDGQHFPEDLPKFLETARVHPEAMLIGVRDFIAAGCPTHRRRSNAVSTFWFWTETGVRLGDTQCGFRCYPLALTRELKARSGRYAFELEFMVRASWMGTPLVAVPVKCTYAPDQIRQSHFRPVRDLAHITFMNIGLVAQSWTVPKSLRAAWSRGEKTSFRRALSEFFGEHAHEPWRMSLAVGLGLFLGIAPMWGVQTVATAVAAHWLRLNKAIAVIASNISIPPFLPFILYAALALGHWMFTGEMVDISAKEMTKARALDFLWHWFVGSLVLASLVAAIGIGATYTLARMKRRAS